MARTAAAAALTRRFHRDQVGVRAAATRDLQRLWSTVDPTNLRGTIGSFAEAGAVVIGARNRESAEIGGRYFRAFRIADGIGAISLPGLADAPGVELAAGLIRGAGLSGIINARRAGFSPAAAARNGFVKVAGSASSLVLAGGRDTVIDAIGTDVQAAGWQRITSANPCDFCTTLAGRGPVYSANTADFEPHDHCACATEPVYR